MTTAARKKAPWPRVLIVEEDPELALATMRECVTAGLEPKLCLGPDRTTDCPGLHGEPCPRSKGIEATMVSITSGDLRRAAPSCIGGGVVLAGERPLVGPSTVGIVSPEHVVSYPYEPDESATLLSAVVRLERKRRAWLTLRERLVPDDTPEELYLAPEAQTLPTQPLHEIVAGGDVIVA